MKYEDYRTEGEIVYQKLKEGEALTEKDLEVIKTVLYNPLQEFCKREAPFRLCDLFAMAKHEVDEGLLGEVEDTIRNVIDCHVGLYDDIDSEIGAVLEKEDEI
jgi:hypothetical protein